MHWTYFQLERAHKRAWMTVALLELGLIAVMALEDVWLNLF